MTSPHITKPTGNVSGAQFKVGGVTVRMSFGHLDHMPRCEATGLAVHFCSHCESKQHTVHDQSDLLGFTHNKLANTEGAQDHV